MKQLTLNFQNDLEATGETMTSSLPVASHNHASHSQQQEKEKAQKTLAISGRRCLELFEKSNLGTSWAKMFVGLLVGTGDWYSIRCVLTWKLKVTKSSRYYFQLQASTHRTKGTESGLLPTVKLTDSQSQRSLTNGQNVSHTTGRKYGIHLTQMAQAGLLLTPTTRKEVMDLDKFKARMEKYPNGTTMPNLATQVIGMLPTPCATEATKAGKGDNQKSLTRMALRRELLPTPRTSDERMHWKTENWKGDDLGSQINEMLGTRSHLSPQFVMEMMGFPIDWTELPFQNGGKNQSKEEVTQSSRK